MKTIDIIAGARPNFMKIAPIPLADIVNVTLASFAAVKSGHEHRNVLIDEEYAFLYNEPGK